MEIVNTNTNNYHTCIECGREFQRRKHGKSRTCSRWCAFWVLVDKSRGPDSCWLWKDHVTSTGYGNVCGRISDTGKRAKAHRVAWRLHNACDPDQLYVLHRCDNPLCVNPRHLFIGSQRVNMLDAWAKGRSPANAPGSLNALAKLDDDAVRYIRIHGGSPTVLARRYGVTPATIYQVKIGQTWKHVTLDLPEEVFA